MKTKEEAGFTLIELLLIITIMGVLMGVVALNMVGDIKKTRLKEATAQFYSDLKKCRVDAMTNAGIASTRGFGFNVNNATSYTLFRFDDADSDYRLDAGETFPVQTVAIPNGVQVRRPSGDPLTAPFLFDRRGWLRGTTWSTVSGGTYILELTGAISRCIVLSTSQIRQGAWNGTTCDTN